MADQPPANEPKPEEAADETPADTRAASEAGGTPEAMAMDAVESAQAAAETLAAETGANGEGRPLDLPDLSGVTGGAGDLPGLSLLDDVDLNVKIELGRTRMFVEDVLRLTPDSVIELDKAAGDPVDVFVNDRHVARGEVLVVNDSFCVRISEIVDPDAGREVVE